LSVEYDKLLAEFLQKMYRYKSKFVLEGPPPLVIDRSPFIDLRSALELLRVMGFTSVKLKMLEHTYMSKIVRGEGVVKLTSLKWGMWGRRKPPCIREVIYEGNEMTVKYWRAEVRRLFVDLIMFEKVRRARRGLSHLTCSFDQLIMYMDSIPHIIKYCSARGISYPKYLESLHYRPVKPWKPWREVSEASKRLAQERFKQLSQLGLESLKEEYRKLFKEYKEGRGDEVNVFLRYLIRRELRRRGYYLSEDPDHDLWLDEHLGGVRRRSSSTLH